jgi:glycerol-3-phosphate dehydrogenase (NAD(P)+)
MRMKVAVVGAGSWGTTVAHLAAHNAPTTLWARDPELAAGIDGDHRNERYLAGYDLHPDLHATSDMEEAVSKADVVVMGVPTHGFRSSLRDVATCIRPWVPIVSLSKGFEVESRLRMSEICHQELPGHPVAVLTGPNLAKEILAGFAAAAVVATEDEFIANELRRCFRTELFRVYTNPDVCGSEVGGALKNVVAIAAGMADGLGAGDNTRAAVITRGLAEITRLGVALGGKAETFAGLAGMGDLVATCMSPQSRNRHVGERIGQGLTIDQVIAEMDQVAEGVKACRVALDFGEQHGVPMPITSEVVGVCHDGNTAQEAYRGLLRQHENTRE